MSNETKNKRVYISADYDENSGDREVVEELNKWGQDNVHIVNFVDMAKVKSGSVSNEDDCRICDLKAEFNRQINASSAVIFVVGKNTGLRTAGSECERISKAQSECYCTPYKQNVNGRKSCKVSSWTSGRYLEDFGEINEYSYLRHEFEQSKKRNWKIIIVYNSMTKRPDWLPSYMHGYESIAQPFWIKNCWGNKVGNYSFIKKELGYE